MNCQYFHEQYVELLDPDTGPLRAARTELTEHLTSCRPCGQFYGGITRTLALLQPSRQVGASPHFKEQVMSVIAHEAKSGLSKVAVREGSRLKTWQLALAAGIAALLVSAALLFLKSRSAGEDFAKLSAFNLVRQACAAEESFFAGEGIISIVNEIVVQPVSDPTLAKLRWFPIMSLEASGKTRFHQLTLPAEPGEQYSACDYAWYDRKTGRFARVLMVKGKAVFANSCDGKAVYLLEPDAAGVLRVVETPVTQDFHAPKSPAEFLGIAAGLAYSLDEKHESLVSEAGRVKLRDGSAGRAIKVALPGGGPEEVADTYWLWKIRETDSTIAEMEWVVKGQSMLVVVVLRERSGSVTDTGIPWDLAGYKSPVGWPGAGAKPGIFPDMVLPDVSVQSMVERANCETYIFATDPPWASQRVITDILDVASPPHRMFAISYRAGDGRHVVLDQSASYNKMLGPLVKTGRLVYTSPNGFKVWSGPRGKWLAGILLQSMRATIKDPPSENRTGYMIETPAGTFPALAINGVISDDELHGLVDSLVPAKEYVQKQPAPGDQGKEEDRK